jgi:hypothetical protein
LLNRFDLDRNRDCVSNERSTGFHRLVPDDAEIVADAPARVLP